VHELVHDDVQEELHTPRLHQGAHISFLSAFPDEDEYLFPPLTFLDPLPNTFYEGFQLSESETALTTEAGGQDLVTFSVIEAKVEVGAVM